jgi:hypothetical protein
MPNSTTVMPDSTSVILDSATVIPDSASVIPAPDQVRGFNIRDPVVRQDWIADQVRNDNGVRNDSAASVLMGRPGEKSGGARLSVAV